MMLGKSLRGPQTKKVWRYLFQGIGKANIVSFIWRLLLENSWVWQRHRLRRNEFLAIKVNCTARNAPILVYDSLLFICLWEWIYIWAWI